MFWGRGDSSKLTPEERLVLDHLRRLEETGHIKGLTPENTEVAIAAVRFYAGFTATTGMLAGARNVAIWIGGMLAFVWTFRDSVENFLKSIVGG